MKYVVLILSFLTLAPSARAGLGEWILDRPDRWDRTPQKDYGPINEARRNIDAANGRIGQLNAIIAEERRVLDRELYPRLEDAKHALSIYDAHYGAASDAQLAVNDAINYLREAIITNRAVKTAFDRMTKKSKFDANKSLSSQIRDILPKLKLHGSTRRILEQWVNSVALLEATQPDWREIESRLLPLLSDSKTSTSELLVEHLRELNDRLASEIAQLRNGREQDVNRKNGIESAIVDVQTRIGNYLTEISALQRQCGEWQKIVDRGPV